MGSSPCRPPGSRLAPSARASTLALVLLVAGCGRGTAPPPETPREGEPGAPIAAEAFITRADLVRLLDAGLGSFLQRIETEPARLDGEFRGFRLKRLDITGPNAGLIDLGPGDIVQALNGRSIDRPEQALEAWESLRDADAIVVSYVRDGERRELRVPVVE